MIVPLEAIFQIYPAFLDRQLSRRWGNTLGSWWTSSQSDELARLCVKGGARAAAFSGLISETNLVRSFVPHCSLCSNLSFQLCGPWVCSLPSSSSCYLTDSLAYYADLPHKEIRSMRAKTWRCMFASVSRTPCLLPSTSSKEKPWVSSSGEMRVWGCLHGGKIFEERGRY